MTTLDRARFRVAFTYTNRAVERFDRRTIESRGRARSLRDLVGLIKKKKREKLIFYFSDFRRNDFCNIRPFGLVVKLNFIEFGISISREIMFLSKRSGFGTSFIAVTFFFPFFAFSKISLSRNTMRNIGHNL